MKFEDFFSQKKTELVQLTIPLRQEQGLGVTYVNMCNPEKADVMYLPLSNELVPVNMKKDIVEKNKEKPSDLYFYFYNNTDNLFIVYDLVN
jgi:hypothetical protein